MADESSNSVSREDVQRSFDDLREELKLPSPESIKKRRELLKRQAEEILKKYPKKAES